MMTYDNTNIFAKILRGEIPCKKVFENDFALAFEDIAPAAPTHLLVIPKAPFANYSAFVTGASPEMVQGFFAAVAEVAKAHAGEDFRLITNHGAGAGQTVFHFHMHILAGKPMGALLP